MRIRASATTTICHRTISSSVYLSRRFAPKPRIDKNIKEDRTVGRHFKSAAFSPKISISIPLRRRRSQEVKKTKRSGIRAPSFFLSLSKGSLVVVVCALKDAREREIE